MKDFHGKKVLITGGASGIGKIMGRLLLEKGAELIIWDIDKEGTAAAVKELSEKGKVSHRIVDISDFKALEEAANSLINESQTPDLLINNAGIVAGNGWFNETSHRDINKTMSINAMAPMHLTLLFLPIMVKRNSGHICNITSSAGLVSNPRMATYVASKWAATGWSDSLRLEMKQQGLNIKVTTVTPYFIDTGMFEGVKSSFIPILKPEKAATKIVRGIEKNRCYTSIPLSMHFIRLCQGVLPIRLFDWMMGSVLGIYKTMEQFTGRKKQ